MFVSRIAGAAALLLFVTAFAPAAQSQTGGMHPYAIVDPVLKQTAWTLQVPSGWNAAGTMMPGSTCNGSTSPIFRATSADGGTGSYLLPRADWTWMSAWTSMTLNAMRRRSEAQTQAMLAQGRLAQAQRNRAHADFMASFQRGADIRNQQFAAGQYRKQNNNDNYVDYILGCQRAYSGNTRVSAGNCPNRQTF